DAQTKQLAVRGVDDLKIFVRRAPAWSDADTAKAEALAQELEQLAGRPSAQVRAAEALGLDAGARAFVAREGAAIASALDRAAQALRANPGAHDPLQHVLRALQPLRGLAAVNDLPPLPDVLEGIERAIAELSRAGIDPPANVGELFQAGATAIARAAREVAERGPPRSASCAATRSARRSARSRTPGAECSPTGWRNSRSPPARPSRPAARSRVRPPSPPSCAGPATYWCARAAATRRRSRPSS